jgi:hypothetical protein
MKFQTVKIIPGYETGEKPSLCAPLKIFNVFARPFQVLSSDEWRAGGTSDYDLKPRFSTSYNAVPTHE